MKRTTATFAAACLSFGGMLLAVNVAAQTTDQDAGASNNGVLGAWCNADQVAKQPVTLLDADANAINHLATVDASGLLLGRVDLPQEDASIEVIDLQKSIGQSAYVTRLNRAGEGWEDFDPNVKAQTTKPPQIAGVLDEAGDFGSIEAAWFWLSASQAVPLGGADKDQWRLVIAGVGICSIDEVAPSAAKPIAETQKPYVFNVTAVELLLSPHMIHFLDGNDAPLEFVDIVLEVDQGKTIAIRLEVDKDFLDTLSNLSPQIFAESPLMLPFREHELTLPLVLNGDQAEAVKARFIDKEDPDGTAPLFVAPQPTGFLETPENIRVDAKLTIVALPNSLRPPQRGEIPVAQPQEPEEQVAEPVPAPAPEVAETPAEDVPPETPKELLTRVELSLRAEIFGDERASLTNQYLRECRFTLFNGETELFTLASQGGATSTDVAKNELSIPPEDFLSWDNLSLALSDAQSGLKCALDGAKIPAAKSAEQAQPLSTDGQTETADIIPYGLTIEATAPASDPTIVALYAYPSVEQFNTPKAIFAYLQMIARTSMALNQYHSARAANFSEVRSGFLVHTDGGAEPIVFENLPATTGFQTFSPAEWHNLKGKYDNVTTFDLELAGPQSLGKALDHLRQPVPVDRSQMVSPVPPDKILIVDMVAQTSDAKDRCDASAVTNGLQLDDSNAPQIARLTIVMEDLPFDAGSLQIDDQTSLARCGGADAPQGEVFVWLNPQNQDQTSRVVSGWDTIFDDVLVDVFER